MYYTIYGYRGRSRGGGGGGGGGGREGTREFPPPAELTLIISFLLYTYRRRAYVSMFCDLKSAKLKLQWGLTLGGVYSAPHTPCSEILDPPCVLADATACVELNLKGIFNSFFKYTCHTMAVEMLSPKKI